MQQLLDGLKNAFPEYREKVNRILRDKTSSWDGLFDTYGSSSSINVIDQHIYRGILHVVHSFLNSDKQQLFIQFPTNELGKDDRTQKKNQDELQEIIADMLFLASKKGWEGKLNCPVWEETDINELYYSDGTVWEIVPCASDSKPRPRNIDKDNRSTVPVARNKFNSSNKAGIRVLSKDVPPQKIKVWVERINLYRRLPELHDANDCVLVGAKRIWQKQPVNTGCIYSPVHVISDLADLHDESCDILVFLWDKKYLGYEREINNLVAEGKVKKIIYIGTHIFDGFKSNPTCCSFAFTFRELFSYYYGVNETFPVIKFQKIDFPALTERVEGLASLIPRELEEFDRKRIMRYALYPFLTLDKVKFSTERFREFLWDNYEVMSPDEIDSIVEWIEGTSVPERNPKQIADDRIVPKNLSKPKYYIRPYQSYKSELNAHLKTSNSKKQIYVIDALMNDRRYVENIKDLLTRGCLGTYYILSYFDMPFLYAFFEDEVKVYNGNERHAFIDATMDLTVESNASVSGNLLDYYDASIDDLSIIFTATPTVRQFSYTCSFDDDQIDDIVDGEVIFGSSVIRIDEIYDNKAEFSLPCPITYYRTPSNFQHLMEVYFNFPAGQSVDSFANLWKAKIQSALSDRYGGNVEEMWKDFKFLTLKKLKDITRKRYTSAFPEEMKQLARNLHKLGILTEGEVKWIRAAHTVKGKYSSKAKELKASLIQYRISGEVEGFLKQLLINANARGENMTAKSISDDALLTRQLTSITLNKK